MPSLIRTLDWDTDKVRCTTCGLPWALHPHSGDSDTVSNFEKDDYFCIVIPNQRAAWWVKEEIRP